jgi:hypothetical protein
MKLVLKKVRLSFPKANTIAEPDDYYDPPKYAAQFIIKKDDPQLKTIENAINGAIKEGTDKFGKSFKFRPYEIGSMVGKSNLLQDGDSDKVDYEPLKGSWYFKATSQFEITCLSTKRVQGKPQKVDPNELYSGDYVNVSLNVAPYQNKKGDGVTFFLGGVQATFTGESLSNDAEKDFDYEDEFETNDFDSVDDPVKF